MNKSEWHERNKERTNQYMRAYRKRNTEKVRASVRRSYKKHREKYLAASRESYHRLKWPRHLQKKYGITVAQFNEMQDRQNHQCAICPNPVAGGRGRFHVDHCHITGRVRGLLCNSCNHMLGNARDNPTTLRLGAAYLTSPPAFAYIPSVQAIGG